MPLQLQDIESARSSPVSSDSSSSASDQDDVVYTLSETIRTLKAQVETLKTELDEVKRDATLANNLRIAHKDKCQSLEKDLKNLQAKYDQEVPKLVRRNETLQDLLAQCKIGWF